LPHNTAARINAQLNISLGLNLRAALLEKSMALYRDPTQLSTKTSIAGGFCPIHGIAAARSPNRIAGENKFIHGVLLGNIIKHRLIYGRARAARR
jgi:hypothetical protein